MSLLYASPPRPLYYRASLPRPQKAPFFFPLVLRLHHHHHALFIRVPPLMCCLGASMPGLTCRLPEPTRCGKSGFLSDVVVYPGSAMTARARLWSTTRACGQGRRRGCAATLKKKKGKKKPPLHCAWRCSRGSRLVLQLQLLPQLHALAFALANPCFS